VTALRPIAALRGSPGIVRLSASPRSERRFGYGGECGYAAGLLGIDRTKISNVEVGVRPVTPTRVRTLACNYACADAHYVDALVEMAEQGERG
jgi:hypothetical protein